MDSHRTTVSIPKACQMAGVSRRTIYNWLATNKVQYVRTAGGAVRIFTDSLFRSGNVPVIPGEGATDGHR
jgi:excisionase family DNA binding protein